MNKNFFNVDLIVDKRLFIKNNQKLVILFQKTVFKNFANLMIKLNRFLLKKSKLSEFNDLIIENLLYYHKNKFKKFDNLTIEI